jgi:hypothetical protein
MFTSFKNLAFALRFVLACSLEMLALQHCPAAHSHYHLDSRPVPYFQDHGANPYGTYSSLTGLMHHYSNANRRACQDEETFMVR